MPRQRPPKTKRGPARAPQATHEVEETACEDAPELPPTLLRLPISGNVPMQSVGRLAGAATRVKAGRRAVAPRGGGLPTGQAAGERAPEFLTKCGSGDSGQSSSDQGAAAVANVEQSVEEVASAATDPEDPSEFSGAVEPLANFDHHMETLGDRLRELDVSIGGVVEGEASQDLVKRAARAGLYAQNLGTIEGIDAADGIHVVGAVIDAQVATEEVAFANQPEAIRRVITEEIESVRRCTQEEAIAIISRRNNASRGNSKPRCSPAEEIENGGQATAGGNPDEGVAGSGSDASAETQADSGEIVDSMAIASVRQFAAFRVIACTELQATNILFMAAIGVSRVIDSPAGGSE